MSPDLQTDTWNASRLLRAHADSGVQFDGRATTRADEMKVHLSAPIIGLWLSDLTGPEAPVMDRTAIGMICEKVACVWCVGRPKKSVGRVAQYGLGDIKVRVGLKNEQ